MPSRGHGFRNFHRTKFTVSDEEMLLNKAQLLQLSAPEMTVLVGGGAYWTQTIKVPGTVC